VLETTWIEECYFWNSQANNITQLTVLQVIEKNQHSPCFGAFERVKIIRFEMILMIVANPFTSETPHFCQVGRVIRKPRIESAKIKVSKIPHNGVN
jgi:hypothetical protein